ncbi:MAG: DUF882 domain-containing protein [Rubrivivax sp.]|nr:MAG: DUF882 domain-containing protein [Rubrivivax sp.]
MDDKLLGQYFRLSEFLRSDTAIRKGIDNMPGPDAMRNIETVLAPGMARVRNLLQCPILVTSGYRSPEVNRAIGSASTSQHTLGLAADFTSPDYGTPRKIAQRLMEMGPSIRFDQLIWEGTWVHISFVAAAPRGQVLTANFARDGRVTYSPGIA